MQYYAQAIGGQLSIMRAARPVETWLADPGTPPDLRGRLELARGIREFASRELALPRNGSYDSYAELGRPSSASRAKRTRRATLLSCGLRPR